MFCGLATTNGDNPWKGGERNGTPTVRVCVCVSVCVSRSAGGVNPASHTAQNVTHALEVMSSSRLPLSPVGAVHLNNQHAAPSGHIATRALGPGTLNPAEPG